MRMGLCLLYKLQSMGMATLCIAFGPVHLGMHGLKGKEYYQLGMWDEFAFGSIKSIAIHGLDPTITIC